MSDENGQQQQETQQQSEGSQLRQELESKVEENRTLKQQLRSYAFRDVGLDPNKGVGKLVAQAYDGPADPEAIRRYLTDNEINVNQPEGSTQNQGEETVEAPQSRQPTGEEQETAQVIGRISQMQTQSAPVEGSKVSKDDWYQLSQSNPEKAEELLSRGLVDLPPHLADQLAQ